MHERTISTVSPHEMQIHRLSGEKSEFDLSPYCGRFAKGRITLASMRVSSKAFNALSGSKALGYRKTDAEKLSAEGITRCMCCALRRRMGCMSFEMWHYPAFKCGRIRNRKSVTKLAVEVCCCSDDCPFLKVTQILTLFL